MPEQTEPESKRHIDPLIAVQIPQRRALRADRDDGIDHLLPQSVEAGAGSWIGQRLSARCDVGFRQRCARRVGGNQRVEMDLLPRGECLRGRCAGCNRPKRSEGDRRLTTAMQLSGVEACFRNALLYRRRPRGGDRTPAVHKLLQHRFQP